MRLSASSNKSTAISRAFWQLWLRVVLVALAASWVAQAQTEAPIHPQSRPLALNAKTYHVRVGEPVEIDAPPDVLDFLTRAKSRRVVTAAAETPGFVFGPSEAGDKILLVASLALRVGEYQVGISASDDAGRERTATLDIVVEPMASVPLNATQPPVILLNGWQESCPVTVTSPPSASTFDYLEQYLTSYDNVSTVYWFDNCAVCPSCTVEQLSADLGQVINSIQYTNGTLVPQVDLIAHSMGGLIVRSYLSGKQFTSGAFNPPANPKVRKAIFIATPHFGSYQASVADFFLGGVQTNEMTLGSQFLFDLATWNQFGDDLRGTDAIAVIGNAVLNGQGDGVVSLTSASLRFAEPDVRTRIVNYCHITFSFLEAVGAGCARPGIAYVTGTSHPTYQIVQSFLSNGTAWETIGTSPGQDPYLSANGGLLLANKNPGNQYFTGLTSVSATNANLSLTPGPNGTGPSLFYKEWVPANTYNFAVWSGANEILTGTLTAGAGGGAATFFKEGPAIFGVQSSASPAAPGRIVQSGGAITIRGSGFGSQQCSACQVLAALPGATVGYVLQISSWSNQAISAYLPTTLSGLTVSGLFTIYVQLSSSSFDSINIMTAQAPTISASPTNLQFTYTIGGAIPAVPSVQITNTAGGVLVWSATSNVPWLTVTPASGTAPSTIGLLLSPTGLTAGSYTGTVLISATGATNTPFSITVGLAVAANPNALVVSSQALGFSYTAGGAIPAPQSVSVTNAASGTFSWTASSSATWLTVSPTSGSVPSTLSVSVSPAGLPVGAATGVVTVSSPGIASQKINVTLTIGSTTPTGPQISVGGVFNAATFLAGGIAPNEFISVIGTGLGPATGATSAMTALLSGTRIYVGGTAAFLIYAQSGQVNALVPFGVAGAGSTTIQGEFNGVKGNIVTVPVVDSAPGVFTQAYGPGQAWLVNGDGTFNSSTNPAGRNTYVAFWATGQGLVNIPQQDGAQPTGPPYPNPLLPVTVTIGGAAVPAANVVFTGLVYSGEIQINVLIPDTAPTGTAVPLVVGIGGASSRTDVTIAVK